MSNEPENNDNKKLFSRLALGLFIAGLLGPFALAAAFGTTDATIGFGVVSEILAVLFACLSWSAKISKTVLAGLGIVVILVGIAAIFWSFASTKARNDAKLHEKQQMVELLEQAIRENPPPPPSGTPAGVQTP